MASLTLHGNTISTIDNLPEIGSQANDFTLVADDLSDIQLSNFASKNLILNIFPSIDTDTCQASVREFNKRANELDNTVVLCVSADLPFAQKRFCGAEGLSNVINASSFRSPDFGKDYGVTFTSGPLTGLLSRAVVIIDTEGKIIYTQQVGEVTEEPDYINALAAL